MFLRGAGSGIALRSRCHASRTTFNSVALRSSLILRSFAVFTPLADRAEQRPLDGG